MPASSSSAEAWDSSDKLAAVNKLLAKTHIAESHRPESHRAETHRAERSAYRTWHILRLCLFVLSLRSIGWPI